MLTTDLRTTHAIAALDLLLRAWRFGAPGEDSLEETAENIRDAIASDGLRVVIERQLAFEMDEEQGWADEADQDPDELAPLTDPLRAVLEGPTDD